MKRKTRWILISLGGAAALLFFLYYFRSVSLLLLASWILGYLLLPFVNGFTARGVPVSAAILICYGMFFTALLFLLGVVLPIFLRELRGITESLPIYYRYVMSLWEHYIGNNAVASFLHEVGFGDELGRFFEERSTHLWEQTLSALALLPKAAVGSLLLPILSYYFLRDKEQIVGGLLLIFPPEVRVSVTTLWEDIDGVLRNFIGGNLLVSLFVALLTFFGLWLLGVDYAAVLGIFYGILDLIPYFGPFLGAVPVVIFPLLQGDVNIFLVILLLFAVQQIENYFISPRILGDQVGLHPVSVILLVLLGGIIGGVLGMVLAIPLAAVARVLLIFFYEKLVATTID